MINHEFLSELPPARNSRAEYSEELAVIQQLLEQSSLAVRFSYPTVKKATAARETLKKYICKNRWQLTATQRKTDVYIVKK